MDLANPWDLLRCDFQRDVQRAMRWAFSLSVAALAVLILTSVFLAAFLVESKEIRRSQAEASSQIEDLRLDMLKARQQLAEALAAAESKQNSTLDD